MKRQLRKWAVGVAAVAAVGALAVPAEGASKKLSLSGPVDGDSEATGSLVAIKSGGLVKSVKNIRLADAASECTVGDTRIGIRLKGRASVDSETRTFDRRYGDEPGSYIRVSGKVSRSGGKVKLSLRGGVIEIAGAGTCKVPTVTFTAK